MSQEKYDASKILYEALNIGEQMLICGAEVHRVEDTIARICRAYGMKRVDVFTITSSIVVTVVTAEDEVLTQTRRIAGYETHLDRLSDLNALSRSICSKQIGPAEVRDRIAMIMEKPSYSVKMQYFMYALVSGMFTLFFGGSMSNKDNCTGSVISLSLEVRIPKRRIGVPFHNSSNKKRAVSYIKVVESVATVSVV